MHIAAVEIVHLSDSSNPHHVELAAWVQKTVGELSDRLGAAGTYTVNADFLVRVGGRLRGGEAATLLRRCGALCRRGWT